MGKMIDEGELVKVLEERATNEAICGYMTAYDVTNGRPTLPLLTLYFIKSPYDLLISFILDNILIYIYFTPILCIKIINKFKISK